MDIRFAKTSKIINLYTVILSFKHLLRFVFVSFSFKTRFVSIRDSFYNAFYNEFYNAFYNSFYNALIKALLLETGLTDCLVIFKRQTGHSMNESLEFLNILSQQFLQRVLNEYETKTKRKRNAINV